jgi:hypothetical protein
MVPEWGFEPHNSIVLYKPPAHDGYLQPHSRALKWVAQGSNLCHID